MQTKLKQKLKLLNPKLALSVFLSLQIGVEPAVFAYANAPNLGISSHQIPNELHKEEDPIWQQFAEAKATGFKLSFDANDPAIDRDPYFTRSQSWKDSDQAVSSIRVMKTSGGIEISVPEMKKVLKLDLALNPIQSTEEFIFFSLDSTSDLFKRAAGLDRTPGEGIFFIHRDDLVQQAKMGNPAPVFFFPLAGSGWTGTLSSLQMPQIDSIVIANQEESVAIELRDVATVMKAQQINLMMASALTAKNRNDSVQAKYPAPGMTAAFGLFFTGLDLQMPAKSLWQSSSASYGLDESAFKEVFKKFSIWFPALIKPAQAFTLPEELVTRLVFVGSVLTGMLATSVVIKYAHPGVRKKLAELRSGEEVSKNPLKIVRREVKETFDVFAAVTTTAAQIASVTFANSLELFLDKFAPAMAAADHGLVRRFLKNTFYFSRDSVRKIPVNSKTFMLGAIVMGGVDTAMVAIQYQVAVPWIAQTVSPYVGEDMQNRIDKTFDPTNPNTKQIALQDTVRNGIVYLQVGASSYSAEARAQEIDAVTREVESEMKARGQDPEDPKYQSEKNRKIEEKINRRLKQKGLPDSSQFLFDMSTVFSTIPKMLGYKAPEELQAGQSFLLEQRFGLSKNALKKAIEVAAQWVKADSSQTSRDALAILEETLNSMSFMKGALKGSSGLAEARRARQQLTILSYEGAIEYAMPYLPETWARQYSPQAAQAASVMFRQALYSYLSKEGDDLLFANKKNAEKFGQQAKDKALESLKKDHPEVTDFSNLTADMQFELKLRTQMEINNLARAYAAQESAEKYTPPKQSWYARRQTMRAQKDADKKMEQFLATAQGQVATDEILFAKKQSFFRDALAKQVGLYIEDRDVALAQGREDYIKMLDFVDKKATEQTESEFKQDQNLARYLEKATEAEKAKLKMFTYANNFFAKYKEATTESEMVRPIDPAQPGRFQRLRQTEIVRNSMFLTRTLRTLESFSDDQPMKLGLKDEVLRNVPFVSDLMSSHKRMLKTILPALSVSYLWNFFVWQVHIPFSSWVVFTMTAAATISAPSQWLNRVFRMNGIKAMDGVLSKIAYGLPYAWVTFAGMFPIMLYSGDVSLFFSDYIRTPITSVLNTIGVKDWLLGLSGSALLMAKLKTWSKKDLSKTSAPVKNLFKPKVRCESLF